MTDDGPAPEDDSEHGDAQAADREDPSQPADADAAERAGDDREPDLADEREAEPADGDRELEGGPGVGEREDGLGVGGAGRDDVAADRTREESSAGTTVDGPSDVTSTAGDEAPGRSDEPAGAPAVGTSTARGDQDGSDRAGGPDVEPGAASEGTADEEAAGGGPDGPVEVPPDPAAADESIPEDVRSYDRFQKVDRASYDRVNEFLRDRTYVTAREWAIARLCADFRTATGVEMTKIGEHLPELVPFMTDTYTPQAVNQARSAFEGKVRMAGATFLYGAMSGFFTADELDDLMYEVTEVAKFLLEVEGVELTVDEELDAEDRISAVMREVRRASEELRYDEVACPHCGEAFQPAED